MTVSLIISTYNWPRALHLCLDSVMQQTIMPTEILIADDGSGVATRDVVEHFARISPVPVRHIWHEDTGFRLSAIRNKAIAASRCEYIIQVDGDVVLNCCFIHDHIIIAQRGFYVSGSRALVGEKLTAKVLSGEITSLSPLFRGIKSSNNAIRFPIIAPFFKNYNPEKVRGCNMAFWREDLYTVNGYDEDIVGWGCEDNELAVRLRNSGLRKHAIKFRGVLFHLYHPYASRDKIEENTQIHLQTRLERKIRCEVGLNQYLQEA